MVPDFATIRDKAVGKLRRMIYGVLSLGWRGSARHWHRYETAYLLLAEREVSGRERTFWRLMATGCALWIMSDLFGILAFGAGVIAGVAAILDDIIRK